MNSFENLFTSMMSSYTSKILEDAIDKEFYKKNELKNLSDIICKTLELTNFIEGDSYYRLVVEKESDTVLNF